ELDEATALLVELRGWSERFGSPSNLWRAKAEEAILLYLKGLWLESERLADEVLTVGEGSYHATGSHCVRAKVRLARGDIEGADAESAIALERARQAKDPQNFSPALTTRAKILLAIGRADETAVLLEELRGSPSLLGELGVVELAWCARSLGSIDRLRVEAEKITMSSRWLDAAHAIVEGDLVRAADVFAAVGARGEEAYARLGAAEAGLPGADLPAAIAFFREQGARGYLQRAEALLAASA